MKRSIVAAAFSAALLTAVLPGTSFGQEHEEEAHVLVRLGDRAWEYHPDQLQPLATKEFMSSRGTKKNPAIPLNALLMKDTKVPLERIIGVAVIGEDRVLFLEGEHLRHLTRLLLKIGSHELTLVPENEETYKALRSILGKPRLEAVERIDIFERRR